eukprot:7607526-Alexandrium_andersonii.AAC.1
MSRRRRRRTSRGASRAWQCGRGVSDFRRFGAAEKAIWPFGHVGTAVRQGWISGPELTLTKWHSERLGGSDL